MKFRYKVLIINIILLSIGISTTGYFMIDKNVSVSIEAQIKNATDENNTLQSAIEYQLLDVTSSNKDVIEYTITKVAPSVTLGISANQSDIFIIYDGKLVYDNTNSNKKNADETPYRFVPDSQIGQKQYVIINEGGHDYLYVSSCSILADAKLNIINKRDISDVYNTMENQLDYYCVILLLIITICSIFMYIISRLLTKPLENLNKISLNFGKGDYSLRANVTTNDEVGELANTYNFMAQSVEDHVDELEDMIKRQDQFIADFTHEIKTPMTSIIGYADTIRSREMSRENQILSASYIFNEGKRLETMSRKLFDLIYTKQKTIDQNEFGIDNLMDAVNNSVAPALEAKNIKLNVNYEPIHLIGDIELLKSAFINLIDNARKASKENSTITFEGKKTNNGYSIMVEDFGVGIAKEHLDRITDAFYMVDKSRSRKEGGAGLGLSLANLIFTHHEAEFKISSTVDIGTRITITFPANHIVLPTSAAE